MLGDGDGGQQRGEPLLGAGEFLVAGRQHTAGDEHVPQVSGGPGPRMLVKGLVSGGEVPGGQVGEDGRADAGAQPVQRGRRGARRGDRFEHGGQVAGDSSGPGR